MGQLDSHLDRLLKSAAGAVKDTPVEAPFGFDTRVVALWRAAKKSDSLELVRFVHRVAMLAVAITIVASAFTYRQISEDEEIGETFSNEYAIADSAIETEFLQ